VARATITIVPEILDRVLAGGKIRPSEAQSAAMAAAGLRHEFLKDAFEALQALDPSSLEFGAFKQCMRSMGETLVRHGIVSNEEMSRLWIGIEMMQ